jgi:hypothetical protein
VLPSYRCPAPAGGGFVDTPDNNKHNISQIRNKKIRNKVINRNI